MCYLLSDRISDCSDDLTEITEKIVTNSQINGLNGGTKQCAIYFYYSTGGALAVCASCMINLVDIQLGQMYATRKHVIDSHAIDGRYCSEMQNPLFLIFLQHVLDLYTVKNIAVNMEWFEDDIRSILETEIQSEKSATESRLISPVQFLRYR